MKHLARKWTVEQLGFNYLEPDWSPPLDIYRSGGGLLFKYELAGVRLDDIRISIVNRRLTVEGVRRDWVVSPDRQAYSMEIAYSRFERSIELPAEFEHVDIQQDYRDGMLLLAITPRSHTE